MKRRGTPEVEAKEQEVEAKEQEVEAKEQEVEAKEQRLEPSELLKEWEFAEALSVTVAAVRKWRYQGRLQAVKLGRAVRLHRSELERVVSNGLMPVKARG